MNLHVLYVLELKTSKKNSVCLCARPVRRQKLWKIQRFQTQFASMVMYKM